MFRVDGAADMSVVKTTICENGRGIRVWLFCLLFNVGFAGLFIDVWLLNFHYASLFFFKESVD